MGSLGDLYKLQQNFSMLGVACLIRRWYEQLDITGTAVDLALQWVSDVVPTIATVVSDECIISTVVVENMDNPTDFASIALATYGLQTSEPLPAFMAWGFAFPSENRNIRAGLCRIPGLCEEAVENGVLNPLYVGVMGDVADALADTLVTTFGRFRPSLYTPGNVKTGGLPLIVPINTGVYTRITTQNTRKS